MSKPLSITLIVSAVLLVVAVAVLFSLWYAVKQQPVWYVERATMDTDSPESHASGEEMEQGIARVVSGFEKSGKWEAVFTEQQINSYLATTLKEKHPELLPPELHDPRVKIDADSLTLAARIDHPVDTVVSLKVDVYLPRPNNVAVRIRQIRAGTLPWPLGNLITEISKAADRSGIPLHWTRSGEDPVAIISINPSNSGKITQITACQLEDGRLYLAGTTQKEGSGDK